MDKALETHLISCLLHLLSSLSLVLSLSIATCAFLLRRSPVFQLLPLAISLFSLALCRRLLRPHDQVYLREFACFRPPRRLRVPVAAFLEHLPLTGCFDDASIAFMSKLIAASGIGNETHLPHSLHYIPPSVLHQDSIDEARMLLFPVLDDLFARAGGLSPRSVDVLVLNCSGFCPAPSLTSMIVNHFAMRDDVKTFNLSGMGCSANAIGVDVARSLLKVHGDSYAVVLSTEIISTGWYNGKDRRKLLLNCFFRMGSAAVLLTNKRKHGKDAKYKLVRLVRAQRAFDDRSYRAAFREEDSEGITGFSIERHVLAAKAETLRDNLRSLAMVMLPLRKMLKYALIYLANKYNKGKSEKAAGHYLPNFGVQHYCLPATGRPVIREIGKAFGLEEREMEPALAAFERYGNQSSASVWYQLSYLEAKGRVKAGEKVLQLGLGSGPKCNTIVWERLRDDLLDAAASEEGPWSRDCLEKYPVGQVLGE